MIFEEAIFTKIYCLIELKNSTPELIYRKFTKFIIMDGYGTETQKKPSKFFYLVPIIIVAIVASFFLANFLNSMQNTQTEEIVKNQCNTGKIEMSNLKFNRDFDNLRGTLENIGEVDLEEIIILVTYSDGSEYDLDICQQGICLLVPGEKTSFSVTLIGDDYEKIIVATNCASDTVFADEVEIIG
jgi:hypothetical protein